MLYTNTIIPTVSTSINVVHSAHCAIIVCCVCGSLGRWNWSIIKAPMCCHLSLWDLRPCDGGRPGGAHICHDGHINKGQCRNTGYWINWIGLLLISEWRIYTSIGVDEMPKKNMSRRNFEVFILSTSYLRWMFRAWCNKVRAQLHWITLDISRQCGESHRQIRVGPVNVWTNGRRCQG